MPNVLFMNNHILACCDLIFCFACLLFWLSGFRVWPPCQDFHTADNPKEGANDKTAHRSHDGQNGTDHDEQPEEDGKYFAYQPAAEKIIHLLNLLENATHTILKRHIEFSSKLHPSIHYLFTKLSEVLVNLNTEDEMNLDKLCESLIPNANLTIDWIARIEEQPDCFSVKKVHGKKGKIKRKGYSTWYDILNAFVLTIPHSLSHMRMNFC